MAASSSFKYIIAFSWYQTPVEIYHTLNECGFLSKSLKSDPFIHKILVATFPNWEIIWHYNLLSVSGGEKLPTVAEKSFLIKTEISETHTLVLVHNEQLL